MRYFRPLALVLLLAASALRAEESNIDVVLVVDVTIDMERGGHFSRAQQLLLDLADRVALPGAQIAVIPFGDGVHEPEIVRVGHGDADAAEARARLRRVLEGLRAHDPHRFLHAALERGVAQLRSFARHRPDHERRMVVVSTGSRNVPAGASTPVLADRIKAAGDGTIAPGAGFTIWYGYFGNGDDAALDFIAQRGAGVALRLDPVEPMRWTPVKIETPYVAVGDLPEGAWKRRVRVFVSGVPGAELAIRCDAGTSAVGATLTVLPPRKRLKRGRSTVACDLSGFRPAGGRYRGAHLRFDGVGPTPLWVTGSRVPLDVGPDSARATVDASELGFGRVDRGTQMDKIVRIAPNESAQRRRAQVEFEARDVPADVDVTVEPKSLRLDRESEITIRVAPRRSATPGTYESRIVLLPRDGLHLQGKEIRVRYQVGHGSIRVVGDALDFGELVRGTDKVARLTMIPDLGAVETGARVHVTLEDVPPGLDLELQEKFTLFGKSELEVRARVPAQYEDGPIQARIRFEANSNVRVVPDSLPITITIVPPPTVKLGDVIEIGRVRQSELDGYEFSFPVDIDRAHHGTVIELVPQAAGTRVEPNQARLREGRQWLRFRLVSDKRDEGKHAALFAVQSVRDGARREEGEIRLVWTTEESYLRFVEWRDPAPLARGATIVNGTLVLDASPDLRGRRVRLRTRFPESDRKTKIAAFLDGIELLGGSQSITVPIDVVSAEPGEYPGVIELSLRDASAVRVSVKPVSLKVVIPEPPTVYALLTPEKRGKLFTAAGIVAGLLLCLLWLLRRNRRPVHRMVRFTPPPTPRELKDVVDAAEMFAFEEELR